MEVHTKCEGKHGGCRMIGLQRACRYPRSRTSWPRRDREGNHEEETPTKLREHSSRPVRTSNPPVSRSCGLYCSRLQLCPNPAGLHGSLRCCSMSASAKCHYHPLLPATSPAYPSRNPIKRRLYYCSLML